MLLEPKTEIVYGPINSRRLGSSLGINLLPGRSKVCTFDCIYCQYGFANPVAPGTRWDRDYPSVAEVIRAIEDALETLDPKPAYLTFSGNGEATLHPEFGTIVESLVRLRDRHTQASKTAILSNSSMVTDRATRRALERLDVRIMKLDAGNEALFRVYNRPGRGLTLDDITDGLELLSDVTIQSLFTGGALGNNSDSNISEWITRVKRISPIMVQVYTLDRESPSRLVAQLSLSELETISERVRESGMQAEAFTRR
jgi:wyosine [tRNA(Phe)-imidazoG37] synthetase (radical SAM superfamily)